VQRNLPKSWIRRLGCMRAGGDRGWIAGRGCVKLVSCRLEMHACSVLGLLGCVACLCEVGWWVFLLWVRNAAEVCAIQSVCVGICSWFVVAFGSVRRLASLGLAYGTRSNRFCRGDISQVIVTLACGFWAGVIILGGCIAAFLGCEWATSTWLTTGVSIMSAFSGMWMLAVLVASAGFSIRFLSSFGYGVGVRYRTGSWLQACVLHLVGGASQFGCLSRTFCPMSEIPAALPEFLVVHLDSAEPMVTGWCGETMTPRGERRDRDAGFVRRER
jgi:hypothetical protein